MLYFYSLTYFLYFNLFFCFYRLDMAEQQLKEAGARVAVLSASAADLEKVPCVCICNRAC